jgi:hypothetical protein
VSADANRMHVKGSRALCIVHFVLGASRMCAQSTAHAGGPQQAEHSSSKGQSTRDLLAHGAVEFPGVAKIMLEVTGR